MINYCAICHGIDGKFNRQIVGTCEESGRPVCAEHAHRCFEDGHSVEPLPEGVQPRIRPIHFDGSEIHPTEAPEFPLGVPGAGVRLRVERAGSVLTRAAAEAAKDCGCGILIGAGWVELVEKKEEDV